MRSLAPRSFAYLVMTVAFAACSGEQQTNYSAATSTPSENSPAVVAASVPEPTAIEISNYELDMDKMRRYAVAIKGFSAVAKTDTGEIAGLNMSASESTAQTIARIEAHPRARQILSQAGLSAREYVWITAAYVQAAMTQGLLQVSPTAKIPEGQSRRNVDFLIANKAELESIMKDAGMKD